MRGITCELPPHLCFHDRFPHPLGITLPALVALVKNGCSFTFAIRLFYKSMDMKQIRDRQKLCWIL